MLSSRTHGPRIAAPASEPRPLLAKFDRTRSFPEVALLSAVCSVSLSKARTPSAEGRTLDVLYHVSATAVPPAPSLDAAEYFELWSRVAPGGCAVLGEGGGVDGRALSAFCGGQ